MIEGKNIKREKESGINSMRRSKKKHTEKGGIMYERRGKKEDKKRKGNRGEEKRR